MALKAADRVKENTNTSGTGALTLTGAVQNFVTFDSVLTNGDTTYYCIVDNNTTNWEVGRGTFTSPATLSRDEVFSSSNSGALVNFTSATKDVFINYPANKALYLDINSDVTLPDDLVVTNTTSSGTFVGGNVTSGSNPGHTHTLNSGATDVTATASELNLLDLSGLTVNDVLVANSATTASWQQLTLSDISDAGTGITLDYVTTNGDTTTNSVTVGNFNSASITDNATSVVLNEPLAVQPEANGNAATFYGLTGSGGVRATINISDANDTAKFYCWDETANAFDNVIIGHNVAGNAMDYTPASNLFDFNANNITTTGALTVGQGITYLDTGAMTCSIGSTTNTDIFLQFLHPTAGYDWTIGVDNTDGAFTISNSTGLGTSDYIKLDASVANFQANDITTTGNISCVTGAAGSFTSTGIDDNANGERLQIADTTAQFGATGQDYILDVGSNDNAKGTLYLRGKGTGQTGGGDILLFTAADHDTTYNYYRINVDTDDFRIGTNLDAQSGCIYAESTTSWNFLDNSITTTGDINAGLDDNSTHVFEGFLTVNNEIQVSDGTAADPSYTFTNYSTTGLYASLNNLNFSVNGTNEASLSTTEFNLPSNRVTIGSTEDVGLNQNGALVIGNRAGVNIGIDNNEIMARNNSAAAVLNININGGRVDIGSGGLDVAGDIIGPTSGGFYAANDGNNTDTSNTTPAQATTNVGTGCKIYGGSDNGTDLTEPANINICSHWGLAFMGSLGPGVWYTNGCGQHIPSHLFNCRTGDFTARGDVTAFGGASDIRLKKDIEPIDNAVERLEKINGVNFTYKDNPDKPMIGVIAQELLEDDVLKKLVYETSEDKHYAVRYEHLTAILVQAVKELSARVKELENAN